MMQPALAAHTTSPCLLTPAGPLHSPRRRGAPIGPPAGNGRARAPRPRGLLSASLSRLEAHEPAWSALSRRPPLRAPSAVLRRTLPLLCPMRPQRLMELRPAEASPHQCVPLVPSPPPAVRAGAFARRTARPARSQRLSRLERPLLGRPAGATSSHASRRRGGAAGFKLPCLLVCSAGAPPAASVRARRRPLCWAALGRRLRGAFIRRRLPLSSASGLPHGNAFWAAQHDAKARSCGAKHAHTCARPTWLGPQRCCPAARAPALLLPRVECRWREESAPICHVVGPLLSHAFACPRACTPWRASPRWHQQE